MKQRTIMCPMRDGVLLATDLYLPDHGEPSPLILMRTPYGKDSFPGEDLYHGYPKLVEAGYAVAVQDCRGTGASQGRMDLNAVNEHDDGYDAVEWLAQQPFCNGRIGMYGLSYFGFTQLAAAAMDPPHLQAICPFMTLSQEPFGASRMQTLNLGHLGWALHQLIEHAEQYMPDAQQREAVLPLLEHWVTNMNKESLDLPIAAHPAAQMKGVPLLEDYLALVEGIEDPAFWQHLRCPLSMAQMRAASFHATGWLDIACDATIDNYLAVRRDAPEQARENARLLIGPWTHGGVMPAQVDDVVFAQGSPCGPDEVHTMMHRWFDRWLKDAPVDCFDSRVRYFMTGTNEWHRAGEWPPPETAMQRLYLTGEGRLISDMPEAGSVGFVADPMDPAPAFIQDEQGRGMMADWRMVLKRRDVLHFETLPLQEAVSVAGSIRMTLYAATDVPDTDFACRLVDIDPEGRQRKITAGIIRARHRHGMFHNDLLHGETVCYTFQVGNAAHCFLPGHRIGLHVTGALFPANDRNLNTGEPAAWGTRYQLAHDWVFCGGEWASFVEIPVLNGEG